MATVTPPYYFDEFLSPARRSEPSPRERALGFTVKDLDWLHTLFYATDVARRQSTVRGHPMLVERLQVNPAGQPALPLAGVFMISATPDGAKAVLYTPYGGLEVFGSHAALLKEVARRLKQPGQRAELLQFLSIAERGALPPTVPLTVTTAVIQGAVMEDQEQSILVGQQKNLATMLDELRKLPSLRDMLDTLLGIMARSYFPDLNQADTRVNTFRRGAPGEDSQWVASQPLREVLLRFYVQQSWPVDQTHRFFNPAHDTRRFNQDQLAEDQQRWNSLVEQTSGTFSSLLKSLLQSYWNADVKAGQSRLQFFAQAMRDTFRADLMLKHQQRIVSSGEHQTLRSLFLPDQTARAGAHNPLNVEKVRVHTPFQHYVDLAGTLMLSTTQAYLYTQARGLQVLANLDDLNATLLTLLKTAGHEDELLNFLSLDERNVFVGMDQIQVTGQPVVGDVFQQMLEDILAKQFDNLEYVLGQYRRSAGEVDLGALLDSALDVRNLLDSRLLEHDTDGRWSVRPVSSGNGRPATVLAEKARLHLQRLQTIEAAMAQDRSQYPVYAGNAPSSRPNLLLDANRARLGWGMLQGLSAEAHLRQLRKNLPANVLALLGTALNTEGMTRLTRHGLNGFIPDAFSLALKVGVDTTLHTLANCFVLTERGGNDSVHSGAALLWTPRCGYEAFASIKRLCETLAQRLTDPMARLPLIENLPVSKRVPHQVWQLGPLQRLDGHLLESRQQTYSDCIRDEIDQLSSIRLHAKRFEACMDSLIRRAPPTNLPRAIAIARALVNQQALPVWLGMAKPAQQILHAELLEQYRISAPDERDYLHSITPMRDQVVSSLSALLNARFPGQVVNPDTVMIPGRINLPGNVQSLTDFALRHLPELRAEDIRPRSRTATPLPPALDGNAVVQLVRQLDLKSLYQKQLTLLLKGTTEDARQRRALFCRQLPWQLLQYAHEQTLDNRLSAAAWSLLQQVFDMPDAVARAAVRDATAMVRPLELIATPGATRVKALGCYLIGAGTGPLILYAPYSPEHLLKEYANAAALLTEFTTPGALQDWLTGQMQAPHQATYRNLLGPPRGSGASDIQLGDSPIEGNVLSRMFQDNSEMLLRMLTCQFSRLGKAQWDAVTRLLGQGIPAVLQFIPGKLAYPLVVWRSYQLFKTSAEDLQQHRWQHALRTFAGGVAELATLRNELDRLLPASPPTEEHATLKQWLEAPAPSAPPLADMQPTAAERTRLQVFEHHDIGLTDLAQIQPSHVYVNGAGTRHFVPLGGKVYPVKQAGQHWRLSKDELLGPYVQRNPQGEWVVDLDRHRPHYGKTLTRYAGKVSTRHAERQSINIEAVGMRDIAGLSSWKAQCINEALNVATYYAVNCKRNLTHFAALREPGSRLGQFFSELFGIVTLTPDQVRRVERRVDEVLDELTNHTLTSPDSQRFVSGTHRYSPQDTFAFVLQDDADKKIYLLDRFFDPGMDVYQNRLSTPFDISAHARATVLIHEITHIKSMTEDLAYLDTMRPFEDLINLNVRGAALLKTDLADLRTTALSTLTPATLLFKTWDEFTQQWQDFGSHRGSTPLKDKVLSITGARTLDDARSVFMSNVDKRIDTILANADSVTYLISQLGRELDAGA
ncbi:dermonecrotic toxin domain-containing protein [Pseudomonas sp.]|uniref:dermonecrotic toxin domain-containing protein n=1 Tax=Pseudomonas sp. TaxID=306 RepID=UPI003C4B7A20